MIESGAVRVNRVTATKPATSVKVGDVLTVTVAGHVRVLTVLQPGTRRGPFSEACQLYQDVNSGPFPDGKDGA